MSPAAQRLTLLLIGIDKWEEGPVAWRADTIIVVTVDFTHHSAAMLSIPRDLWVKIPGFGYNRINNAHFLGERYKVPGGGPGLLKATLQENFGITVDRYVRVDYRAFIEGIDLLGGITVDVVCPVDLWLPDKTAPGEWRHVHIKPGLQHMDGVLALQYVRTRERTTDFDRNQRQQAVLLALRQQALRTEILPQIPALWRMMRSKIDTDLSLVEIMRLARLGLRIKPSQIRQLFVDRTVVSDWHTPRGGAVLRPDWDKIAPLVEQVKTPAPMHQPRVPASPFRIAVRNGTPDPERLDSAVAYLHRLGFENIERVNSAGSNVKQTSLVSFTDRAEVLNALAQALNVPPERIRYQPETDTSIDVLVTIGQDFRPCALR